MKNEMKKVIFSNDFTGKYYKQLLEDVRSFYPENTDDEIDEIACDWLYEDYDDLIIRTDEPLRIIGIADLGLWDGHHIGWKMYDKFSDIFYSECDYSTRYLDRYHNLRFYGVHHDGRNEVLYRIIPDNVSDKVIENFTLALMQGKNIEYYIRNYTTSLGKYYVKHC